MGFMSDPQSFSVLTDTILKQSLPQNHVLRTKKLQKSLKELELEEAKDGLYKPKIGAYAGAQYSFFRRDEEFT